MKYYLTIWAHQGIVAGQSPRHDFVLNSKAEAKGKLNFFNDNYTIERVQLIEGNEISVTVGITQETIVRNITHWDITE